MLAAGAVFEELRRLQPRMGSFAGLGGDSELGRILRTPPVTAQDLEGGHRVAPVIGWGRLSVSSRYEDWLLVHGAHPWFSHRHKDLSRAEIPTDTHALAGMIEFADSLLIALDRFANADSFLDVRNDCTRIGELMGRWRRLLGGGWEPGPVDTTPRVKLPDSFWLRQWDDTAKRDW